MTDERNSEEVLPLEARNEELERRVDELKRSNDILRAGIIQLESDLVDVRDLSHLYSEKEKALLTNVINDLRAILNRS